MSDAETPDTPARARFWPRAFACTIDICLIGLIIGLLGVILFPLTDGRIRVGSVLFMHGGECNQRPLENLNLRIPASFRLTHALHCTRSVLGHVHDRTLVLAEVTRSGAMTYTRSVTVPVDADWRPTQALYLDGDISVLLLAIYVLLLEWRYGRTLGKDLMKVRVRSLYASPITLAQAAVRVLIRFFPIMILMLSGVLRPYIPGSIPGPTYSWIFLGLSLAAAIALLINFAFSTRRGALPWHDQCAGTDAVRGR